MSFASVKAFGDKIKTIKEGIAVKASSKKTPLAGDRMKVTPHPAARANGGVPGTLASKKIKPQRG